MTKPLELSTAAHKYELARNANVEVKRIRTKDSVQAEIIVNGNFSHIFAARSRISQHLTLMTEQALAERLSGGSFFFIEGSLVDFRDSGYNGFVHSDETIATFMKMLGATDMTADGHFKHRSKNYGGSDLMGKSEYALRRAWSENDIHVPGFQAGGEFTTRLSYAWNPFQTAINADFDMVRLICSNGMIGTTSFLNTKIPVLNRWEEHMDIASVQIQNKVEQIVRSRLHLLANGMASVDDVLKLRSHAQTRYENTTKTGMGEHHPGEFHRLRTIRALTDPDEHLAEVYRPGVFENSALAAKLPAHFSLYDAYNLATEMRTHTSECRESTDYALDRFANGLLFDRNPTYSDLGVFSSPKISAFSDPDRAFFGEN